MPRVSRRIGLFSLLASLALAPIATAQSLIERVPADAIAVLSWEGIESRKEAYAASRWKALAQMTDAERQARTLITNLLRKHEGEEAVTSFQAGWDVMMTSWDKPCAAYVRMGQGGPVVTLVLNAGTKAAEIEKKLATLGPPPGELLLTNENGILTARMGRAAPEPAAKLAATPAFSAALKEVGPGLALIHINLEPLSMMGGSLGGPEVSKALAVSGLMGVKSFTLSGDFDSGDWKSNIFLAAPNPRNGLVRAFLPGATASPELLASVPADAVTVTTGHFDAAGLLTEVRAGLKAYFPEQQVDYASMGLSIANAALGVDLEKSLLATMGKDWVFYQTMSEGTPTFTLVNVGDRSAEFAANFQTLLQSGSRLLLTSTGMRGRFWSTKTDGYEVKTAAFPVLSFCYAQSGKRFVIASSPELVAKALKASPSASIAQNSSLVALQKRLAAPEGAYYSYIDLPRTVPAFYQQVMTLLPFADLAAHFGKAGVYPTAYIPDLEQLMTAVSPAGGATWVDAQGWHARSITPFPGAEVMIPFSGGNVMQQAQMASAVSVLLPSLNRARETANRVKCASNLRQIGQGIQLYANENKGKYPDDFAALIKADIGLGVEVFVCPSSSDEVVKGIPPADWVNERSSYVYLGKGLNTSAHPDIVVVHDKPENHDHDGVNVLFGDGRVEFILMTQLEDVMEQSKKLREEWEKERRQK